MPNTYILPEETFKNSEALNDYTDQFLEIRGTVHICLMGSYQFKTASFDIKEGSENGEDCDVQVLLENLLQAFLIKGFPFISVADGGFEQCHDLAEYFGLTIENHNKKKCFSCIRGRPRFSEIMKNKIKDAKQTFIGRIKETVEEKKRSKSQDQETGISEMNVSKMLKNRKTESYKSRVYDKKNGSVSNEKYAVMFNETYFAVGKTCKHEKFPTNLDFYYKLDSLLKITSLRDDPAVLNFCFGNQPQVLSYKFKTKNIARQVINQVKKYYSALKTNKKKE